MIKSINWTSMQMKFSLKIKPFGSVGLSEKNFHFNFSLSSNSKLACPNFYTTTPDRTVNSHRLLKYTGKRLIRLITNTENKFARVFTSK